MTVSATTVVCQECFGNAGLKLRVVQAAGQSSSGKCQFHPRRRGITVSAVASIVDEVARENYHGGVPDDYDEPSGGLELNDLIFELTGPEDDDVAEALKAELIEQDDYWPPDGEEAFYDEEYVYHRIEIGTAGYGRLWEDFEKHLMYEQRFFSADAFDRLKQIFEGVEKQTDAARNCPVYMIQPKGEQSIFYRARIIHEHSEIDRFREDVAGALGPPPDRKRTAGRLNPSGVTAFYGAFDPDTCVAELRPPVGTRVALSQFTITEAICVLDTTRFAGKPRPSNLYKEGSVRQAAQWNFMRNFMAQISRPVRPGEEHLDYIPTQAVAEFLANHLEVEVGGKKRKIDAIIYASAQNRGAGKNIAILGDAAVTGELDENGKPVKKAKPPEMFEFLPEFFFPKKRPIRVVPVFGSFVCLEVSAVRFTNVVHRSTYVGEDDEV